VKCWIWGLGVSIALIGKEKNISYWAQGLTQEELRRRRSRDVGRRKVARQYTYR
jgi:hypothetical protein